MVSSEPRKVIVVVHVISCPQKRQPRMIMMRREVKKCSNVTSRILYTQRHLLHTLQHGDYFKRVGNNRRVQSLKIRGEKRCRRKVSQVGGEMRETVVAEVSQGGGERRETAVAEVSQGGGERKERLRWRRCLRGWGEEGDRSVGGVSGG